MKTFYAQFIRKGDLCFDIGANHGERSIVFYDLGANLVIVEPQNNCLKELNQLFNRRPNVTIIPKALGARSGVAKISISNLTDVISIMSDKWKNQSRFKEYFKSPIYQDVEIITINSVIEEHGIPSFCKIDVEGYELEIIKVLNHKIKQISFEFTLELIEDADKILNHLQTFGEFETNFSLSEDMKFTYDNWVSYPELLQLLKQFSNLDIWGDIYIRYI